MPPQPQPTGSGRSSIWLTVLLAVVILASVAAIGWLYMSNSKIAETLKMRESENSQLQKSLEAVNKKLEEAKTAAAQLACKGVWENNECKELPPKITASPTSGKSPLKVTFTIEVPASGFTVDFGDGATTPNTDECKPGDGGYCSIKVTHTYTVKGDTSFNVKVTRDGSGTTAQTAVQVRP